ncbi:beta-phosphoglucomutase [Chitinophaga sancti]|uniref:Beta-phosphoglucomutase n=1 Tax=Chitinophaga sancti TaxID=1004 RepID=A0A1K1QMF1_9BACT|nr:beta-phosphoglucomutase [Chitinophaga sancti]WQD65095.1 beta-phosphoglucomutase [Chitinophaga sancti]WQG89281.1 beta-phosphoglucomutase [Chitinophaga sancti]SFW61135.1 beta-phosphoglucomutase [Chitinophaga sancti]
MDRIDACIFDLDGVIVDTAKYHYKAWKRLANELGFDFTEEQNELLKGLSRTRSLEIILEIGGVRLSAEEQAVQAARKNEWYVDMIRHMQPDEVLPGAGAFLESLRKAGIKTALGSASKNAGTILERVGLAPLFDVVVDGNAVTASKPDPEVFLKGASALQADPAYCVVFEDAVAGIQAARAGGMKVVGIGAADVLGAADIIVSGLGDMSLQRLKEL